jgi:hypothetical protein
VEVAPSLLIRGQCLSLGCSPFQGTSCHGVGSYMVWKIKFGEFHLRENGMEDQQSFVIFELNIESLIVSKNVML